MPEKDIIERHVKGPGLTDNVIFAGLQHDIRNHVAMADAGFMLSCSVETIICHSRADGNDDFLQTVK